MLSQILIWLLLVHFYPFILKRLTSHVVINPYLLLTSNYGFYDSKWSNQNQKNLYEAELFIILKTGLTKFADITFILDGIYSKIGNKDSLQISDTQVYLGFQISKDIPNTNRQDLRVLVGESFPTGKHDNLDENKLLADGPGSGAYQTAFGFALQKKFSIYEKNYLFVNLTTLYFLSSNASIEEFSIFGGGFGTEGTVSIGDFYFMNLSLEYRFNPDWKRYNRKLCLG